MTQKGGIELFVEGLSEYVSGLLRGSKANEQFGASAEQTAQQVTSSFNRMGTDANAWRKEFYDVTSTMSYRAQDIKRTVEAMKIGAPDFNEAEWNYLAKVMAKSLPIGAPEQFKAEFDRASKVVQQAAGKTAEQMAALAAAEREAQRQAEAFNQAISKTSTVLLATGAAGLGLAGAIAATTSRIEELEVLLEVTRSNAVELATAEGDMARASSLTNDAVQAQVQGIRDLHLAGTVANKVVADLIRYNLDWTKATELARLAQDSATFAMQDSSQAVEGLIRGITTLQPRTLRTYGLMVNLDIAYEKFAQSNRLVAEDLTVTQRQQAALNEVLAQAPTIAGAYEAAMGTASKQLRSLQTDVINLSEEFGEALTPALTTAVSTLRDIILAIEGWSDPLQATIVQTGVFVSGLAVLVGTGAKVYTVLTRIKQAYEGLAIAKSLSFGVLALGGALATVGVAAVTYAINISRAQEEEAGAIAKTTESYDSYIARLKDANLEVYGLTQQQYDLVQATKDTAAAIDAVELKRAEVEARNLVLAWRDVIQESLDAGVSVGETGDAYQDLIELIPEIVGSMTTLELASLDGAIAQRMLAEELGLTGGQAVEFADLLDRAIDAQQRMNELEFQTRESDWKLFSDLVEDAGNKAEITAKKLARLSKTTQGGPKGFNLQGLEDALAYTEAIADATEDARDDFIDAWFDRNQALEKLDRDYFNKSDDLWDDYRDTVQDIEGDIAQYHAGTLKELLDLDKEYQRKRDDAWRDFQRDISDAERELAQDLVDLNRDRLRDLADAQQDYAQDVSDTTRDLNRDLEEMERDLAQKQEEIRLDHLQEMANLEQEYADKRTEILADFAEQAQEIEKKYILEPEPPSFDDLREGLQKELKDLQELAAERGVAAALFDPDYYAYLLTALEATKADELDALDEAKNEQLSLLEQQLADEQAIQEQAYKDELQAAQDAYQERRAERMIQHQERLDDLKLALQREREEIKQGYANREQEARDSLEREKAELDRRYREKLEDIATQYDDEKELIREKLDEQLEAAADKRDEGLKDLEKWYDDQKEVVKQKWEDQKKEIVYQVGRANEEAALKFGEAPSAFAPTYTALQTQAYDEMKVWAETVYGWVDTLFGWLGANSPSTLMMELGESITAGFAKGLENPSIEDLLSQSLDGATLQANIQAAMGGTQAMPATAAIASGASSTSSQINYNLQATFPPGMTYPGVADQFRLLEYSST